MKTDTHETALLAGAARSNITPPLGITLDGPIGQNGPATHIHDELHARCLVLSDGSTTLGFAVCDSTMITGRVFEAAKELVAERTGIPADHLMMTATHSHSVPRAMDITDDAGFQAYLDFLAQRIADGIQRARNQLAPAQLGWTTTEKPEHLNNRRWLVKPEVLTPNPFGDSGERVRMNPPAGSDALIRPTGPVDPSVALLSVQHEDGRPLALLTNYGLHYVGGVPKGHISADYYGIFCSAVERALGQAGQDPPFVALLANGASGNVNNIDFRTKRTPRPPYAKMTEVADDLATAVLTACESIEYTRHMSLSAATRTLDLPVRRPDAQRLAWARTIMASAGGPERLSSREVFAREALFLEDYPPTLPVPLQAFALGDFALSAIPCEVFAETGLAIREASPFTGTCVMSLANAYHGYLPPPEQHELGGYETWPARSSCLATDAEADIRAGAIDMLNRLRPPG